MKSVRMMASNSVIYVKIVKKYQIILQIATKYVKLVYVFMPSGMKSLNRRQKYRQNTYIKFHNLFNLFEKDLD